MAYSIMVAEEGDAIKFDLYRGTLKYLHPDLDSVTVEFLLAGKPTLRGFNLSDLEWHQEDGYGYWQVIN